MLTSGKLEKAVIVIYDAKYQPTATVQVQFNPTEYSISRSMRMSKSMRKSSGLKLEDVQSVSANFATLSVSLRFDSISELESFGAGDALGGAKKLVGGKLSAGQVGGALKNLYTAQGQQSVQGACEEMTALLHQDPQSKSPPLVSFKWGEMNFMGRLTSNQVSYTMFTGGGLPVQAKMDISIWGEEKSVLARTMKSLQGMQKPDGVSTKRAEAQKSGALNPRLI